MSMSNNEPKELFSKGMVQGLSSLKDVVQVSLKGGESSLSYGYRKVFTYESV